MNIDRSQNFILARKPAGGEEGASCSGGARVGIGPNRGEFCVRYAQPIEARGGEAVLVQRSSIVRR